MKSRNLKAKVHELHGMYTVRMIAAVMLIQSYGKARERSGRMGRVRWRFMETWRM